MTEKKTQKICLGVTEKKLGLGVMGIFFLNRSRGDRKKRKKTRSRSDRKKTHKKAHGVTGKTNKKTNKKTKSRGDKKKQL